MRLRYTFSPLGNAAPLFTDPVTEDAITHLAEPLNVPLPISRRVLHEQLGSYYGAGRSLFIELAARDAGGKLDPAVKPQPVPASQIIVCDLRDVTDAGGTVIGWAHTPPPAGKVAVDPALGRLAFPADPKQDRAGELSLRLQRGHGRRRIRARRDLRRRAQAGRPDPDARADHRGAGGRRRGRNPGQRALRRDPGHQRRGGQAGGAACRQRRPAHAGPRRRICHQRRGGGRGDAQRPADHRRHAAGHRSNCAACACATAPSCPGWRWMAPASPAARGPPA